jgi:hypothetical protein
MIHIAKLMAGAIAIAAAGGCVTNPTLQVTYETSPPGGAVYEGTRFWGYGPITLQYPGGASVLLAGQCLTLNAITVRWASGATVTNEGTRVCPADGLTHQYLVQRPVDAPGLDIDLKFAELQLQRSMLEQQAAAAERAAVYGAIAEQNRAAAERRQATTPVYCDGQINGDRVDAVCQRL